MRPKEFDFDPVNVDADGIAQAQAVAGAGDLTLNGAFVSDGVAVLDYARQISVTSAGDDSGITFTISGIDANGNTISEVVPGQTAGTVETSSYFKTVIQITASGAGDGDVSSGTVDEFASQIIPVSWRSESGAAISTTVTGTISYTVQETFDNIRTIAASALQWHTIAALDATTSVVSSSSVGATAIRLIVNSYTSGAEVQMDVTQPPF